MNWKNDTIRIAAWNAGGVSGKINDLYIFLREYDIDILFLGESWLNPYSFMRFLNYQVYRNDRPNGRGGGTAIIIKSSIRHNSLSSPLCNSLEITSLEIFKSGFGPIRLHSIYQPSSRKMDPRDLAQVLDTDEPTLVAGDFNAKNSI